MRGLAGVGVAAKWHLAKMETRLECKLIIVANQLDCICKTHFDLAKVPANYSQKIAKGGGGEVLWDRN